MRASALNDLNKQLENEERDQEMSGREFELSHDQLHEIQVRFQSHLLSDSCIFVTLCHSLGSPLAEQPATRDG